MFDDIQMAAFCRYAASKHRKPENFAFLLPH